MDALDNLKSVLCNPDGKCCIVGSQADRDIVDQALAAIAKAEAERVELVEKDVNSTHTPAAAVSEHTKKYFCYCNKEVSLQMVSGGAAPEGYLGKVTLRVGDQYRDYFAQPDREPLTDEQIWDLAANCLDSVQGRINFARLIEQAHNIRSK